MKVVECDGRKILKVDPAGLELLSKAAYSDVSFYLRAAHLQKLRNILDDPEATDNDKFVAYTMLLNQVVAAEGELPTCQDTGTAICIGHKGEDVYTGADDAKCIAKGVYETYKDRNLRYSQVVPFTMTEEKNSGTNLPAQIDIYGGHPGMEYEFLFITKGGGSANKTFLYQQTKALLNEKSLTDFIKTHIFDLGTSACPPYHLAICIGGTSAEMCLSTVKKASAGYLDELPTSGNEGGRCFRDLEWEEKVLRICQQSGVGAQFGGKYLVHDVRVIRAPRHAASCPVAIGVSCSADRNIKAKITPEGIFLEELEKNPARFLPKEAPGMSPAVEIDLDEGMDKVREILSKYPIVSSFSALHPYKHAKGEGNYQWNTGYEYYLYGYDQRSMGYIDILVPTSDSDGQIVRIICTHFDHCGIDQVIQQQEQNVVTQAGLNNPEYPTILMGDLNVGWGTNVLPEFRNLGDHIGVSWVDHIFAFPKGRWTGHDFKSHSCPAANGKASLSDHDPITATLVLK